MKIFNKSRGFTLMELLVVISIMAVLMASATYIYSNARMKSRDSKRRADGDTFNKAVNLYINTNGSAPVNTTPGTGECLARASGPGAALVTGNAMYTIPVDPLWATAMPSTVDGTGKPIGPSNKFCYYYFDYTSGPNYIISYYTEQDSAINVITNNQ